MQSHLVVSQREIHVLRLRPRRALPIAEIPVIRCVPRQARPVAYTETTASVLSLVPVLRPDGVEDHRLKMGKRRVSGFVARDQGIVRCCIDAFRNCREWPLVAGRPPAKE